MTTIELSAVAPTTGAERPLSRTEAAVADAPVRAEACVPAVADAVSSRRRLQRRIAGGVAATDVVAIAIAVAVASGVAAAAGDATGWSLTRVPLIVGLLWVILLTAFRGRVADVVAAPGQVRVELLRAVNACVVAVGSAVLFASAMHWDDPAGGLLPLAGAGLTGVAAGRVAWWTVLSRRRRTGRLVSRILVVGTLAEASDAVAAIVHERGATARRVVGIVASDADEGFAVIEGRSYPVLASAGRLPEQARDVGADTVFLAGSQAGSDRRLVELTRALTGVACEVVVGGLSGIQAHRVRLSVLAGATRLHVTVPRFDGARYLAKRVLDVTLASLALVPTALIGLFIAAAIVLDDHGPVFFRQTRVGRDGRPFSILKFRTMRVGAEAEVAALASDNEGAGPLFKLRNDPRVTRVGRLLRKTSLDELPQFWNVLSGDMSVVGPRPPLPKEVAEYSRAVCRRQYVTPGITGPWQVGGRSDLDWDESAELDLGYVDNWSLAADLGIMLRTVRAMVASEGAY